MKSGVQLITVLAVMMLSASDAGAILPLRDQWVAANRALLQNQPENAVQLFRQFHEWYADEESTRDAAFQEKMIRLWGLAELQAGSLNRGIELLESWFTEFPEEQDFRAFLRFQLASACLATGDIAMAQHHWATFIEDHATLPECTLVRWLWAESLLSESRTGEAIQQLERIVSSVSLSQSGQMLARAALAVVQLSAGQAEAALELLDYDTEKNPGAFWRSIMAPALADALLKGNKPALALQPAHWFNSTENLSLIIKQMRSSGRGKPGSIRDRIWGNHWNNQLSKAVDSLQRMIDADFGLDALYLLKLQVYLRASSPLEAYHLSTALLHSEDPDHIKIRSKVFRHAIESGLDLGRWDVARKLTQAFLETFPSSPELPDILFLQARCSASRALWPEALESMATLITAFPQHTNIHAWRFTRAKWLVHAGDVEAALNELVQLKPDCPETWREYLEFEQANCFQQLQKMESASSLYGDLMANSRYPAIAEQAAIAKMKISLGQLDWDTFETVRGQFLEQFPFSGNRSMVDLLLGSFLEFRNHLEAAVEVYLLVADQQGPEANHARQQLSRLHAAQGHYDRLLAHALDWIFGQPENDIPPSAQPWLDCFQYQVNTDQAALRKAHLETALDWFLNQRDSIPCQPFLDLLKNKWSSYAPMIELAENRYIDWVGGLASRQFAAGNVSNWSNIALYQAGLLMLDGRPDSADTIRIRVLTTANLEDLNQNGLFQAAAVAHAYDFPESVSMLESFLEQYGDSSRTPECLLMLAQEKWRAGDRETAAQLLQRVHSDWQDSSVFIESSLLLADWRHQQNQLSLARDIVEKLLQLPDLNPRETARSLLIRAQVDLDSGHPQECRVNCSRILTLYPDIDDISTRAATLMESLEDA